MPLICNWDMFVEDGYSLIPRPLPPSVLDCLQWWRRVNTGWICRVLCPTVIIPISHWPIPSIVNSDQYWCCLVSALASSFCTDIARKGFESRCWALWSVECPHFRGSAMGTTIYSILPSWTKLDPCVNIILFVVSPHSSEPSFCTANGVMSPETWEWALVVVSRFRSD